MLATMRIHRFLQTLALTFVLVVGGVHVSTAPGLTGHGNSPTASP